MKRTLIIFVGMFVVAFAVCVQTASAQEDVGRLIKQLEDDSDRFSNSTTKALDNSRFDGTSTEDELIRYVRDFEDSIDRLKKGYDNSHDTTLLAREVQTRSKAIDRFLKKNPLGGRVGTDWGTVKATLLRIRNTRKVRTT